MIVYLLALLVLIAFTAVARTLRAGPVPWALLGVAAFLLPYHAWIRVLREPLVRRVEDAVPLLVSGMVFGLVVAAAVLRWLARDALARRLAADGHAGAAPPAPPEPPRAGVARWLLPPVVSALVAAPASVLLLRAGVTVNEVTEGALYPLLIATVAAGLARRSAPRGLASGALSGLAFAPVLGAGLHLIGRLPLRGEEALIGALVGLPLACTLAGAVGGLLWGWAVRSGDVVAHALRTSAGIEATDATPGSG